jgi:type I restriction enzyme S subunit
MKKYGSYKDSGIDWIEEIPSHWGITKLKVNSRIKTGYTPPMADAENYSREGMAWVKPDNLAMFKPITDSKEKVSSIGIKTQNIVPKNSVLLCCIGSIGKFGVAGIDLLTNQQICSITFINGLYSGFGKYLICTSEQELNRWANGNVIRILNTSNLGNIKYPTPSIEEQTQIAKYLDYKTAQIDDLISKKEKLIELLKEERTAIINQAVTKGLDPSVPMKDSGIEWLGEVPEHWSVLSFRFCIDILTDFTSNGSFASLAQNVNYLEEGYSRLVRLTDLRVNLENQGLYVDEDAHNFLKKSELFGGEMLIANVGAYAGLVKMMPHLAGKHTLGPNMFLLRLNKNTNFFYHQLNAPFCKEQLKMMAVSSAQPKLNKDNIRQLKVVLPPTDEQREIASRIEIETQKLEKLQENVLKEIELLKEYKIALISEVVTGKVDVRDVVV